ncbi:unnamed protein product [Caenorhabditis nigoni]
MIPTTHKTSSEPHTNTRIWSHWFNIRIRQYMILEIFFFISLFMIFYRLQTISNQNDRVLEMVSSMERKLEALVSQKPGEDIKQLDDTQPLEQSDEAQKTKLATQDPTRKIEPPVLKMNQSTAVTDNSTLKIPIPTERFRFNAANFLLGAFVETYLSSRSSLYTGTNNDQSELVILDRPQPPADKAWCSNDQNPVLTISLAKYIKPISVSYQHSKWNETIPKEAPRTYDVVGCLDSHCKEWEPLASNCHYSQYGPNGAEQMCNISSHLGVSTVRKVQFRFRENYGDPNMTCVSLVRVYGETKKSVKMEKHLNSEKTCADLKWFYHNMYIGYACADKSCKVLSYWFNIRIRQYMIMEILLFISLVMIFYRLQTLSNQNDRVLEMVSSMERKLEALVSQKPNEDIREFDNTQPPKQSDGALKTKLPTQDPTSKIEYPVLKTNQSTSRTYNNTLKIPIPTERFRFNAANYLMGAFVETHLSSSSSLYTNTQYDQSELVILDRRQPPADKAWCTDEQNPRLTINLAQYIKPTSVSYQHSEWNGEIPKQSPKTNDVLACFDPHCKLWEPLALNCQYNQHQSNGTEQMCNVTSDLDVPTIGIIHFRFRENYGDPNMTCVNLVRVYGETKTPVKMEKHLNSEKTCADLKWYYHNSYIGYASADKSYNLEIIPE